MFHQTLQRLKVLISTVPARRRRRRSLLAFGDRLENRAMLSAMLIEPISVLSLNPSVAFQDVIETETETETEVTSQTEQPLIAEELDLAFFSFVAADSESEPVTEIAVDSPSEEASALPRRPALTFDFVTNVRRVELIEALYPPAAVPPLRPSTQPRDDRARIQPPRPDVLNESWRASEVAFVDASKPVEPARLKTELELNRASQVADRREDVINSVFNRQVVPEPEARDIVPASGTQAVDRSTTDDESEPMPAQPSNDQPARLESAPDSVPFGPTKEIDARIAPTATTLLAFGAICLTPESSLLVRIANWFKRLRRN